MYNGSFVLGQRYDRSEVLALGFDLQKHHEWAVSALAEHPRQDLWERLGLDGPLRRELAREWLLARSRDQVIAGDRVRLLVPDYLSHRRADFAEHELVVDVAENRRPSAGVYNAWLGIYLPERDLGATSREAYYPAGHWRGSKMQPLARVALAALDVATMTGCSGAEATAWLLCDEPIPAREIVAHFHTGKPRMGVNIWVADWRITAERLGRLFVQQRQWLTEVQQRARGPLERTGILIEYVDRVRPHKGRHKDNTPWREALEEWNNAYPKWRYKTTASLEQAYKQARDRREAPRREVGNG